mgnify:CR=1 FL=1
MKAFIIGVVAMVVISVVAAAGLSMVTLSSQQDFTVSRNVRL